MSDKESEPNFTIKPALPRPLPATRDQWKRQIKKLPNLNDEVEMIHFELFEHEDKDKQDQYRALLYAVKDSQAVEGSLSADNVLAAMMIREQAHGVHPTGLIVTKKEKLATIIFCLGVVLRRYDQDRTSRRDTVDGQVVPNPHELAN